MPNVLPYVIGKVNSDITRRGFEEVPNLSSDSSKDSLEQASKCATLTDVFRTNGQLAFRHINCYDDLLFDLFRTEFHIRLFWGTNGVAEYPHNFNTRHEKFQRVLSALAAICASQF